MTTTTAARIVPGTFVRLTVDEGPASIGLVTEYAHKRADGVQFVAVDFHWDDDQPHDDRPIVLAETTLVPVCGWAETYPDEWGLACSEPGIATAYTIPCHYDAERVFRWTDDFGQQEERMCANHAHAAALDAQRAGLANDVLPLDQPDHHWWGHDEGGEA